MAQRKIRTVIIDDESHARENLRAGLEKHLDKLQIVGEYASPEIAFQELSINTPDLIFLDVEMPEMNGFEFLAKFDRIQFKVIFATAHDQYALRAIKMNALDYLLKPIDSADLAAAIEKTSDQLQRNDFTDIQSLLSFVKQPKDTRNRIAIPSSKGLEMISISDISHCEAEKEYTRIFLNSGKSILSSTNIGEYEFMLGESDFFRIHHSYLVHHSYIESYIKGEGGSVKLRNGNEIPVSRRRKNDFMVWLIR
jgi:two-component system LytT family response regulator